MERSSPCFVVTPRTGLFGANVTPNSWILNPDRLKELKDATGRITQRPDGKVGAQCACCGQPPPIGNVTDLATVKAWSYTSWVRTNGDLSPTNQPAPNHVILHFECWCHRGHRIVLQYIKDHPEQDCSWMVEAYSQTEWNKILVDAGIRK